MTPKIAVLALLAAVFLGCNTTEVDDQGNTKAWWVHVRVSSGYGSGYPQFRQVDQDGKSVGSYNVTQSEGSDLTYSNDEKTYTVRMDAKQECKDPCGYIRAYFCPLTDKNCDSKQAARDFGIVPVSGWDVRI